jgi:uncharacterized phage protein gp47/JayE
LAVNLSISGVAVGNRPAVLAALESTITGLASVAGTIELAALWTSVKIADPADDILITVPAADVVAAAGHLPVLGAITWS